jgi:glycosyltransferase involved in cell wall biosynthesis
LKTKVGYSGPFPPHPSGGAALSYWLVAELVKRSDVSVYVYSTTPPSVWPGITDRIGDKLTNPTLLNALLFYYSDHLSRVLPLVKGKVLLVAHHGFDNVFSTPEELADFLAPADVIIATDKWEKSIFESVGLRNVNVVPYPVDSSVYMPKPKKKPLEILYSGRLLCYKGIIQVLKAMDYVLGKENVTFRIHGIIDANWDGWMEIVKVLGDLSSKYGTRVVIESSWTMPWDMPNVYESTGIFLFPSGRASFGIPMAEAMSCEIPVVTTNYGSHAEVVGNQAGILLQPTEEVMVKHVYSKKAWTNTVPSAESIADSTLKLIYEDELREKMGKAGRERVKELFNSPIVIDQLLKVVTANLRG